MSTGIGHNVLSGFDVPDDVRDYLAELYESPYISPHEAGEILNLSLLGGAEDWNLLIDCASSLRQLSGRGSTCLDGNDVLEFVWQIQRGDYDYGQDGLPWQTTDRLIALAKEQANQEFDFSIQPITPGDHTQNSTKVHEPSKARKRKKRNTESHYWAERYDALGSNIAATGPSDRFCRAKATTPVMLETTNRGVAYQALQQQVPPELSGNRSQLQTNDICSASKSCGSAVERHSNNTISPFFASTWPDLHVKIPRKRPPPGMISCNPFPPLFAPRFGIIQEVEAADPFWLLIVVTFLIKTKGDAAIPVFRKLKERFPSPADLADPENAATILDMIRHLGLGQHRLVLLKKYAHWFLHEPPRAGTRFQVKGYDICDFRLKDRSGAEVDFIANVASASSWEIGHMTQGKYAIDSWRIFCRDVLLHRAEDYNGKGREPEFQPEWMRVMPSDKELRAFLRWMWMKEGWEWDPDTGEKVVLREEMRRAVNEGRVEYLDTGGLKMLSEPRKDF